MKYLSAGEKQTAAVAEKFAEKLKSGDVVLLKGELGAGKTAFTKGLAKGLGVTAEVTSPTYSYMNDYGGKLYHFDAYRLSCGDDAEALGLTDYFYAGGICVIEWYENIESVLPENCIKIRIEKTGESSREIYIGE